MVNKWQFETIRLSSHAFSFLLVAEPGSRVETSGQSAEGTRDSAAGSGEVRRPTYGGLG